MLEPGPAGRVKFQQVQVPGMAAGGTGRALGLGQEAASARQEGFSSILHEELDLYSEGKESSELGSDRQDQSGVCRTVWLGPGPCRGQLGAKQNECSEEEEGGWATGKKPTCLGASGGSEVTSPPTLRGGGGRSGLHVSVPGRPSHLPSRRREGTWQGRGEFLRDTDSKEHCLFSSPSSMETRALLRGEGGQTGIRIGLSSGSCSNPPIKRVSQLPFLKLEK